MNCPLCGKDHANDIVAEKCEIKVVNKHTTLGCELVQGANGLWDWVHKEQCLVPKYTEYLAFLKKRKQEAG